MDNETAEKPLNQDISEQADTETDDDVPTWIDEALEACNVPAFGLDQWLRQFMEEALQSDMPDEKLLNFFCLARDKSYSDDPAFISIMEKTEALLYSRMPDKNGHSEEYSGSDGYEPDRYADAFEELCAGKLSDRQLVELFDLAATLRSEPGIEPMWQTVMYLSRMQILWRIRKERLRKEADDDGPAEDDTETEYVSEREALRIAEDSLRPDMPDAQLLELYVLAEECGEIDNGVWDEIADTTDEMVFGRIRQGTPDSHFDRYVIGFDYPAHGRQALEAVVKGDLPHKNLLMLYRLAWHQSKGDETWIAISDLARAQILRRMAPPPARGVMDWDDWRLFELTRRVVASER